MPLAVSAEVSPDSLPDREELDESLPSVLKSEDFEQAPEIANATGYALTGGVYSRHPYHLQLAREHFVVGNLYLNRRIARAMVDRQPFGGFRLSGMGYNACGPSCLL